MPSLKPLHILLAEDNAINQRVATGLLSKFSHRIDVANNGEEAVHMAQVKKYDLILMDVQMPVMDGIEATGTIRNRSALNSQTPIIALTANSLPEEVERLNASGITDQVLKPLRLAHLFQTISVHLPDKVMHA